MRESQRRAPLKNAVLSAASSGMQGAAVRGDFLAKAVNAPLPDGARYATLATPCSAPIFWTDHGVSGERSTLRSSLNSGEK
jgi:hypothetical protein